MANSREVARGITIDGPTSRDLDDAIWMERDEKGCIVHVSIADVASEVAIGSEDDARAFKRTATRYFENNNDPMLPRSLSEDALSLWPDEKKPTITVSIPLTKAFAVGEVNIRRTAFLSSARLTYDRVDEIIREESDHELHNQLGECCRLAMALLHQRQQKGALAVYDIEHGWEISESGYIRRIVGGYAHIAHIIVQEFMILTNRVVAEYMASRHSLFLYRNHHTKKLVDRDSLLTSVFEDLEQATPERLQHVQVKLWRVLDRARYAPQCRGHFALNIPAYTHFTSPIRRYADLINHRLLLAAIGEEPVPYSETQLQEICEHINAVEDARKDARARARTLENRETWINEEKEVRRIAARKLAEQADPLQRASADDFHKAVKAACVEDRLPEPLELEILRRAEEDTLQPRNVFELVFRFGKIETSPKLRHRVIAWLRVHPDHAVAALNIASQVQGVPSPDYRIWQTTAREAGFGYLCVGTTVVGKQRYSSRFMRAGQKRLAQRLAAVDILRQILGLEPDDIESIHDGGKVPRLQELMYGRKSGDYGRKVEVPMENYKGILNERCQKARWPEPTYETMSNGPPHRPQFQTTVTIDIPEEQRTAGPGTATTRRESEQWAAKLMLDQLGVDDVADQPKAPSASTLVEGGNPISALTETCAKNRFVAPSFSYRREGPDHSLVFICTCNLEVAGEPISFKGEGTSKQEAKQIAADGALSLLRETLQKQGIGIQVC